MSAIDQVMKLFEQAVREKTFSLEVMDTVSQLKKDYDDLLVRCDDLDHENRQLKLIKQDNEHKLKEYEFEHTVVLERTEIVRKRELKCYEIEVKAELEKQRGDEMKEIVLSLTRNTLVRENVFHNKTHISGGYGSQYSYSENDNIERTQE